MSERNMGMGQAPEPTASATLLFLPNRQASKATPSVSVVHTHTEPKPKAVSFRWRRDGRRAVRGTLSDPRARERQARFGRASGPPPVRVKPPWRRAVRILFCFLPRRPHPFSSQ
jgi:hypothetical protein